LLIIAIILIVFLPVRGAVVIFLLLLIVGRDFDTEATASIWQLNIGPIRPSWIVFTLLAIQFVKLRDSITVPRLFCTQPDGLLWFRS